MKILVIYIAALEPGTVRQFHPGRMCQIVSEELTEKRSERHQIRMSEIQSAGMYFRGDFPRTWQLRAGQGDTVFVFRRQKSHVSLQCCAPSRMQRIIATTGVRPVADIRFFALGHYSQEAGRVGTEDSGYRRQHRGRLFR